MGDKDNKNSEYIICKSERDNDGGIIAGREIEKYKSNTMLSPGMTITTKSGKKYKIRCIDILPEGTRKLIIE